MIKVAILASHNGSGFNALHTASKELGIEIPLLISNNSNSIALVNAQKYKIKNQLVNAKTDADPDAKIYELLLASGCTHVFLSGYMKKISKTITDKFIVINVHPALLPNYGGARMYGRYVHEAVIKNKEKISGVTIHEVNEVYDDGEILLQKELHLLENETVDSLESKIKKLEIQAILEAFKKCLK
ncbi:MAG: formyltransferase family protein [Sulfurimonas sp.]|nr:formyltransferase family protein [Sulfurimonas sp.]MDQ7062410.1 formyltransferase family protein [Sulfurimonas sp.]